MARNLPSHELPSGTFSTKEAERAGISRTELTRLVRSGKAIRLVRGIYQSADHAPEHPYPELEILLKQGVDITKQHRDCGAMIFDPQQQDTHCGGSGCGCGASVLCGHFLPMLENGKAHNILFAATGALMSPMSLQQGESIPSISHLVHLRKD